MRRKITSALLALGIATGLGGATIATGPTATAATVRPQQTMQPPGGGCRCCHYTSWCWWVSPTGW